MLVYIKAKLYHLWVSEYLIYITFHSEYCKYALQATVLSPTSLLLRVRNSDHVEMRYGKLHKSVENNAYIKSTTFIIKAERIQKHQILKVSKNA